MFDKRIGDWNFKKRPTNGFRLKLVVPKPTTVGDLVSGHKGYSDYQSERLKAGGFKADDIETFEIAKLEAKIKRIHSSVCRDGNCKGECKTRSINHQELVNADYAALTKIHKISKRQKIMFHYGPNHGCWVKFEGNNCLFKDVVINEAVYRYYMFFDATVDTFYYTMDKGQKLISDSKDHNNNIQFHPVNLYKCYVYQQTLRIADDIKEFSLDGFTYYRHQRENGDQYFEVTKPFVKVG